MTQIKDITRM